MAQTKENRMHSRMYSRTPMQSMTYYCDMCGETIGFTDARKSTGIIWMCPGCDTYVENLPDALNKTTSRFLIGNVL